MFKSRLFPSLVAAAISFLLTLLISRFDLGRALGTGVITLGASFIGTAMYAGQAQYHLRQRIAELQEHIRALQRRRADVYEEWTAISTERDRIAASFDFLQMQLQQLQVKSTDLWQQKAALSWDITDSKTAAQPVSSEQVATLKGNLTQLQQQEAKLTRSIATNLAAKQRADLSLKQTETELNQLQAAVAEQQSLKRQFAQEITTLTEQQQQLETTVGSLQPQVNNLEHYKTELNQFLQSAEPKRQQIETGSKTLHSAIEQLQRQIVSLHSELIQLEGQIVDRRQQKDDLDQELATLKQQPKPAKSAANRVTSPAAPPPNGTARPTLPAADPPETATPVAAEVAHPATAEVAAIASELLTPMVMPVSFVIAPLRTATPAEQEAAPPSTSPAATSPSATKPSTPKPLTPKPSTPKPSATPPSAAKPTVAPPAAMLHPSGLPAEWVDFLNQLPAPEFQALRAIAEATNPAAILKQVAEANLTMPELLVDAINERALDTIGDILLATAAGVMAKVTPDHKAQVKQLIAAYLTQDDRDF